MEKGDVDDIFKDFEYTVEGKKEHPIKTGIDEELKERQRNVEKAFKEENVVEEIPRREPPNKSSSNLERYAYIGVIIVLAGFIAVDLSFYHPGDDTDIQTITAAAVKVENKTNITAEVEEVKNVTVEVKKQLSGTISLDIENIYTEVVDEDRDVGYITKIVFTIDNGKDKALMPVVNIFAYDSELDPSWEVRSRGQYRGVAIASGEKGTGSIDLVPRSFKDLSISKNIRLTLNDTKDGFITSINEKVTIS